MREIKIFDEVDELMAAAARYFVDLAREAIGQNGRFSVALSGGSTPRGLYSLLATPPFSQDIDWRHVHIFWGDERCVPPDHPDSNYRMAQETLLDHVPLPVSNIHRIQGEKPPEQAAADYQRQLDGFFAGTSDEKACHARFDLVLLGMGGDGHTASLFPNTPVLENTSQCVAANYVNKLETWRITLTAPAINAAANVIFIVTGEDKAHSLHQVLYGPRQPQNLPSQLIQPADGKLLWFVDSAAAQEISNGH